MELKEIKDAFKIDYGAPSPLIVANESNLVIAFYTTSEIASYELHERNACQDIGVVSIKFEGCLQYSFGIPGNESIYGHPYWKLGMRPASFYELKDSDWIESLKNIEQVHPSYDLKSWASYKHYILTFHDNMFQCVARDWVSRIEDKAMAQVAERILHETML